ncbi:hypothetical protein T02_1233 [Trichinella nativa]|uniref:Uncharacterized protein n=1 Tax=Trichinella nativa TaxID=6335 RepID=A0A0V1KUJ7_9BILA|nr:hypothetical protein T02_1233 [Trichinella nativa]
MVVIWTSIKHDHHFDTAPVVPKANEQNNWTFFSSSFSDLYAVDCLRSSAIGLLLGMILLSNFDFFCFFFLWYSQKCTTNLAERRQRWSLYRPVSTSESSDGIAWGGRAAPVTSFSHQRDGFSTFSDTLRNSTSVSTVCLSQSANILVVRFIPPVSFFNPFSTTIVCSYSLNLANFLVLNTSFSNRYRCALHTLPNRNPAAAVPRPKGDLVVVICSPLTAGSG